MAGHGDENKQGNSAQKRIPRTEAVNPLTNGLDTWDANHIVAAINAEDHRIAPAIARELPSIAKAAELAAYALTHGKRVFYVGSGTSGRMGVLDASEMLPTYGELGHRFVALISGGSEAVFKSVEGAEDSAESGREDVLGEGVGPGDLVVGIAASGGTPYVTGALRAAAEYGASTVAVVGDPKGLVASAAELVISPDVGPEVVAGSTRMKNGTSQKMILNMISTTAMVLAGRTYSNLMAGVSARNQKLSNRAKRILVDATGKTEDEVEASYVACGGDVAVTLVALRRGVTPKEATALLEKTGGAIRKAADGTLASGNWDQIKGEPPSSDSRIGARSLTHSPNGGVPMLRFGTPTEAGLDEAQVERAFAVLRDSVGDGEGEIPCAVGALIRNGVVVEPRAFGWAVRNPERIAASTSTIFDMASLSKVVATTPSMLINIERGLLRLDDAVSRFIPEFALGGKGDITIRHLLTHTSGLPAHVKFWPMGLRGQEIVDYICKMELPTEPGIGKEVIYSDLGFITLGEILRRVTGMTVDRFAAKEVFGPLEMVHTGYNPPEFLRSRIAATEYRADLGRVMWGEVHDENTLALGGVAGHAGLFSTIEDVARYVLMWLGGGERNGVRILSKATVAAATREETTGEERRALGWMLRARRYSSGGDLMSPNSYGHTGFTGTSIWCDPNTGLGVILLTNRVHAGRDGTAIIRLRPRFANAAAAAVK